MRSVNFSSGQLVQHVLKEAGGLVELKSRADVRELAGAIMRYIVTIPPFSESKRDCERVRTLLNRLIREYSWSERNEKHQFYQPVIRNFTRMAVADVARSVRNMRKLTTKTKVADHIPVRPTAPKQIETPSKALKEAADEETAAAPKSADGEFAVGPTVTDEEFAQGPTAADGEFEIGPTSAVEEFAEGPTPADGEFAIGPEPKR